MELDNRTLISLHVLSHMVKGDLDFSEVNLNARQREVLLGKLASVKSDAYTELLSSPEYRVGVMVVRSSKTPLGLVRLLLNLLRLRRQVRGGEG